MSSGDFYKHLCGSGGRRCGADFFAVIVCDFNHFHGLDDGCAKRRFHHFYGVNDDDGRGRLRRRVAVLKAGRRGVGRRVLAALQKVIPKTCAQQQSAR